MVEPWLGYQLLLLLLLGQWDRPCCPQIPGTPRPAAPTASCLFPRSPHGLLSILLQTMDTWVLWFLLLQSIVHYPQPVGDDLDEATRLLMEERAKLQEHERIRLELEVEQLALMQSGPSWGDLLWSALQAWQVWALVGLLLLLLPLWFMWRKRRCEAEVNGEREKEKETDEEDEARSYDLAWLLEERIQWPVQDLQAGCDRTTAMMEKLLSALRRALVGTFFPVLHQAIGFGSAFEGWTESGEESVYHVLVPLTAPSGHIFRLERDTDWLRPGRNFRVRVELVCSCPRGQEGVNMLCFRHHPDVIGMLTEQPNLLDMLCTGSYLDVEKTVYFFYRLLGVSWQRLPESRSWHLALHCSQRFCHLRLSNGQESFQVQVMLGLQRFTSDIFISSRPRGAHTPSTVWPETYSMAETKFFRHMARQLPQDSSHLKCLQLLAAAFQECKVFSIHSIKTIIMHQLNTVPLSQWHSRYFLLQLSDVLEQLRLALQKKHLQHFIVGNQRLPEEIRLPPDVRMARPSNLFHSLWQDRAAHSQAMQAYLDLRHHLARLLAYGHC
ncbi:inositol 1,4,5-trisphosphate receptor-interacting protein-like 1 [Poecile atricapillus]|uniref:inositol 1,4,5-trisphosphate receptor-interacting protein-like 1 n=2 Tax=Poecile atricapillus TaxID=48891 RepID=UPI0027384ECE|nr:inositol 1,4,5-trisphosphate receptor-interacting protein-like 1 [Poecile atricapillus]